MVEEAGPIIDRVCDVKSSILVLPEGGGLRTERCSKERSVESRIPLLWEGLKD